MAEKYSVLIKYKMLEYIENAKLSDADFGMLMRGIINYDKTGKIPKFRKQILAGLFAILKCDLDDNREKWEERVSTNRVNGKKGGRPPKTKITQENQNEPKKPTGFLETQNNPSKPKKPDLDLDSGSDLDSEFDLDSYSENINSDSGGGSSNIPETNKTAEPPPPIEKIKKESGAHGIFIDNVKARLFQNCGLDPAWLIGPHSFLEFSAERVRKKYPDKTDDALKPIYISAVTSWEDLRDAYPAWQAEQKKIVQIAERKKAYNHAKDNPPKKCQCGGELNEGKRCLSCDGFYTFNEESLVYDYNPPLTESLADCYAKLTGKIRKEKKQ